MITQSHLVFACHSRACAPPPVGTGGSGEGSSGSGFPTTESAYRQAMVGTAKYQRGKPERAMLDLQAAGGGVYPHAAEHVGDLTHRINEMGGKLGTEFVQPKVDRVLDSLTSRYGFEREFQEQVAENYRGRSGKEGRHKPHTQEEVSELGQKYADEHRVVPVFNRPSELARDAAVALGEQRFASATRHLKALKKIVDSPEAYRYETSFEGAQAWKRGDPPKSAIDRMRSRRNLDDALGRLATVLEESRQG